MAAKATRFCLRTVRTNPFTVRREVFSLRGDEWLNKEATLETEMVELCRAGHHHGLGGQPLKVALQLCDRREGRRKKGHWTDGGRVMGSSSRTVGCTVEYRADSGVDKKFWRSREHRNGGAGIDRHTEHRP